LPLFTELPRGGEPVEKVVVGPVWGAKQTRTPPKQVQKTYKMGFSASEPGSEKATRGFFNSLWSSRKMGEFFDEGGPAKGWVHTSMHFTARIARNPLGWCQR
jgi:hypothetical protein